MRDVALVRNVLLLVPATLAAAAWLRSDARGRVGLALGTLWNVALLLVVNVLAVRLGWWRFGTRGGMVAGVPLDVVLGWAALWGIVLPVAVRSLASQVALAGAADLLLMPRLAPAVELGSHWLVGEALALAVALVPGTLLGRWTAGSERLRARAALQAALAGVLCFVLLPAGLVRGAAEGVRLHAGGVVGALCVELLVLGLVLGVSTLVELVERGDGTPFPLDPTRRLVTTGPYAYLANPMQLSASIVLAAEGALLRSPVVAAAAVGALAFGSGFARWQEEGDLHERFGAPYAAYRAALRDWLPRQTPYVDAPALLYVAAGCDACSQTGTWIAARNPRGLELVPAETAPRPLRRMTYVAADGHRAEGVAALGRALEHAGLGWALLGMWLRLPLVRPVVQTLVDGSGGGPREIGTLQACRLPAPSVRTSVGSTRSRSRRRGTASATSSSGTVSPT